MLLYIVLHFITTTTTDHLSLNHNHHNQTCMTKGASLQSMSRLEKAGFSKRRNSTMKNFMTSSVRECFYGRQQGWV